MVARFMRTCGCRRYRCHQYHQLSNRPTFNEMCHVSILSYLRAALMVGSYSNAVLAIFVHRSITAILIYIC